MSANNYGTANPLPVPQMGVLIGGTNLLCPAGVETNIIQWTGVAGISPGIYYPIVWTSLYFSIGATPPNPFSISSRINNGADISSLGGPIQQFPANGTGLFNVPIVFPPSATLYQPPGCTVQISCTPAGQSVTMQFFGCWAMMMLFRAPDQ